MRQINYLIFDYELVRDSKKSNHMPILLLFLETVYLHQLGFVLARHKEFK